jgi:ABC-type multidrug transport system fused ATPase/permease subunit
VAQEPVLFSGTIRENIIYGLEDTNPTQEQIEEACRKSNALSFVKDSGLFPDGLDTVVGERGIKLSGG